jgi:hypothetical protein
MVMEDPGSAYLDAIRFYRSLGFFSKRASMSDEQLTKKVTEEIIREWDATFPGGVKFSRQLADLFVLMTDNSRVWFSDLECVYPGENAYIQFLSELKSISRGSFSPENIKETWHTPRGPVDVEFMLNKAPCKFIHDPGDMIDTKIIKYLNTLIKSSGINFEISDALGMPNFIIALKKEEKDIIERERGLKFL